MVAKNVTFNLIGQGLPILVALFCIPRLIEALGAEKFGVLALAWVMVGYFTFLDLGIGRAAIRLVVQKKENLQGDLVESIFSAFVVAAGLGILGGLFLFLTSEWFAVHFFSLNPALEPEVITSLKAIALVIPFAVTAPLLRGVAEAFQRFDWINTVQAPLGALNYILPLVAALQSGNLVAVIGTLVAVRVLQWFCFFLMGARLVMPYQKAFHINKGALRELIGFGFWVTSANLAQPLLTYLDRFLIGSLLSVVAVAYYSAPMEIVQKIGIIPAAVTAVVFPAFTEVLNHRGRLLELYLRSLKFLGIILFPLCLALSAFSTEILTLWISQEFAANSGLILQIFALAIFHNALGYVPATYVQSAGRPAVIAKLYVIQIPFYAAAAYWALTHLGLFGAAVVWSFRSAVDFIFLHGLVAKDLLNRAAFFKGVLTVLACELLVLLIGLLHPQAKWTAAGLIALAFLPVVWFVILSKEDRNYCFEKFDQIRALKF